MGIYDQIYDVVVVGGGPSGVAAAIAASRNGAKVILLERYGFLGGMATNASIPVFCPYSDGEKVIIKGIGLEILEDMKKEAWKSPFQEKDNGLIGYDWVPIDPEILKRVLDKKVVESNINLLYHSYMMDVMKEDGKVSAIVIANKEGLHTIRGTIFIDCTGDADLVVNAGGEWEYGDEDGLVQGVTLCFRLANVDGRKFLQYKQEEKETGNLTIAVNKARANGDFPFDEKAVATFALQHWDIAGLNFGHVYQVNPLKAEDLTRAEIESRKKLPELLEFLNKYVPGLEQAMLISSGPFIGIRETRRIVGEYRLTKRDYLNRQDFNDTIARYSYPIDIHASTPRKVVIEDDKDEFITLKYKPGEAYGIPYRAMLPKKLENVIVAGRTISADRAMHGSFRVMPCCFATGQAAGTAAALCTKHQKSLREVDICELKVRLAESANQN